MQDWCYQDRIISLGRMLLVGDKILLRVGFNFMSNLGLDILLLSLIHYHHPLIVLDIRDAQKVFKGTCQFPFCFTHIIPV